MSSTNSEDSDYTCSVCNNITKSDDAICGTNGNIDYCASCTALLCYKCVIVCSSTCSDTYCCKCTVKCEKCEYFICKRCVKENDINTCDECTE